MLAIGKTTCRGAFGYDAQKKQYASYWVDSMGHVPSESATRMKKQRRGAA